MKRGGTGADQLSPTEAWAVVDDWLDAPTCWIPAPGLSHRSIFGRLVRQLDLRGNLLSDAAVAALCIEHGLSVVSADSDFARFGEINWINPVGNQSAGRGAAPRGGVATGR